MKQFSLLCLIVMFCLLKMNAQQKTYSLDFDSNNYTLQSFTLNNKEYKVRAFENIIYVANPVDTIYQRLNIYVPEDYYQGQSIGNYSMDTAPIFYPNGVGGYMPSAPMTLNNNGPRRNVFGQRQGNGQPQHMPQPPAGADMKQGSAIHYALAKGFVVVSAGARGRSLQNSEGVYTGKAPAGLVDLKAGICYLRYNGSNIPGDKEKIISNGTSAGGAMSTLLGATGNSSDYKPYLEEIGAANQPDHIFAASAYCPITNLDHADAAYEWQFNGINTYQAGMMRFLDGGNSNGNTSNELTELQIKTSDQLKTLFPIYLNSLNLQNKKGELLLLDEQGNGSFKELVVSYVLASAQKAIDAGQDLSGISWLQVKDKKAVALDFEPYIQHMQRMKTPPAFDAFDMDAPENHLFGSAVVTAQHFTQFSYDYSPDKGTLANSDIIKMMNPMYYIGAAGSNTSSHWHIRYGSIDNNTSLAIEVILATYLQNKGYDVDFALAWDRPHMGDYDLNELFDWIENALGNDL